MAMILSFIFYLKFQLRLKGWSNETTVDHDKLDLSPLWCWVKPGGEIRTNFQALAFRISTTRVNW